MTLVEGEVYFQRAEKFAPVAAAKAEPAAQPAKFAAIPELPKGTYVLKGGTVHQPGKPAFLGTVVVDAASGKITRVAAANENIDFPAGARRSIARGCTSTPA